MEVSFDKKTPLEPPWTKVTVHENPTEGEHGARIEHKAGT